MSCTTQIRRRTLLSPGRVRLPVDLPSTELCTRELMGHLSSTGRPAGVAEPEASGIASGPLTPLSSHGESVVKRRTLPVAAALVATATVLLAACGGSGDGSSKDNDKIAGADTGSGTSRSASPSAGGAAEAGRPKIELPSDLKLTFEDAKTGDEVKDAVLSDSAERMRSVDAATTGTDPKGEAIATGPNWTAPSTATSDCARSPTPCPCSATACTALPGSATS